MKQTSEPKIRVQGGVSTPPYPYDGQGTTSCREILRWDERMKATRREKEREEQARLAWSKLNDSEKEEFKSWVIEALHDVRPALKDISLEEFGDKVISWHWAFFWSMEDGVCVPMTKVCTSREINKSRT